jgi:hypothetical protein
MEPVASEIRPQQRSADRVAVSRQVEYDANTIGLGHWATVAYGARIRTRVPPWTLAPARPQGASKRLVAEPCVITAGGGFR